MARALPLLLVAGLAAAALGAEPARMGAHRKLYSVYPGTTAQRQLKAQLPGFILPPEQCSKSNTACPADRPFVGCCSNGSCDVNPNPGAVCVELDADSETIRACCPQQRAASASQKQGTAATSDQQTKQQQPKGTTGSTNQDNGGQHRKQVPLDQCDTDANFCTPGNPLGACCNLHTKTCNVIGPAKGQRPPICIGSALVSSGCCPA